MDSFLNQFEQKVLKGFSDCGISFEASSVIGVAVSGGADSISLLLSVNKICEKNNVTLKVVTVNHFIREIEETTGDVNFVVDLCKVKKIPCSVKELQPGSVQKYADEYGCGIEEAARVLRYRCFEEFCKEENLDYLCLAHNKNDQLETVLMRFLQGSGAEGLSGISRKRDKYIRPMLNISREEIEAYLVEQNQTYRTDSTNSDCNYLRNRIRNNLVPLLNKDFEKWTAGVETLRQKAKDDEDFFLQQVNLFIESESVFVGKDEVNVVLEPLCKLGYALFYRIILKLCNSISTEGRIPYVFLKELYLWCNNKSITENSSKSVGNLDFIRNKKSNKKEILTIKIASKQIKDLCFSAIIEESGKFQFHCGEILVQKTEDFTKICFSGNETAEYFVKVDFPFVLRNYIPGDVTVTADGKNKKVKDIFSDWKVSESDRMNIILLQELNSEAQRISCIFGKVFGFKDWIVK
ncbi:MAG: tRNA lysidine(34) synthetase TilS [Treponema sp.]|nr:tRNA lysidine(34) synthetase TilS [Treponema sp.]